MNEYLLMICSVLFLRLCFWKSISRPVRTGLQSHLLGSELLGKILYHFLWGGMITQLSFFFRIAKYGLIILILGRALAESRREMMNPIVIDCDTLQIEWDIWWFPKIGVPQKNHPFLVGFPI